MPSVAKPSRKEVRDQVPIRTDRCLKGLIHGKAIFRVTNCRPERIGVRRRPSRYWVEAGWFSEDLLDE